MNRSMKMRWNTAIVAVACLLVTLPLTTAFAQLPTPSYGLNLGNTMEPTCGVGCWGPPMPTQAGINGMAAAGFNTLRVPCAWNYQSNAAGTINAAYMTQVTQIVNWAIAANMYVVIDDHWDGGWFENSGFKRFDSKIDGKVKNMWTQIANNFKNTSSHLLFACANEPAASTQAQTNILFRYYQTFVTTVRGTGGNNATRWLVVEGPSANIDNTCSFVTPSSMPSDPAHSLVLECHNYDPYQFTLMTTDQSWGAMFYFWGAGYHVSHQIANRNATWGEESWISSELAKMNTNFVSKGIPVFIGEWRAETKPSEADLTGQYITQNYNSCTYWNYYFHNALVSNGLTGTCWQTQDIINQTTGAVIDQNALNSVRGTSYIAPIQGL